MSLVFMTVLNMSLTASYCIVVVIIVRLFLKKQPKLFSYLLWSIVLFRLLCPFALFGSFSLLRIDTHIVSQENLTGRRIDDEDRIQLNALHGGDAMAQGTEEDGNMPKNPGKTKIGQEETWMQKAVDIVAWVWLAGMAAFIWHSIKAVYCIYVSLKNADVLGENLYESGNIKTPFVFGMARPRVYLPKNLSEEDRKYVLVHEQIHIARKDYLIKIVAYAAVCIHWFNPLVWVAFALLENDMEMSCDEAVLRRMGMNVKKEYSSSLLSLSSGRAAFQGSPLAFGEGKVKSRVRNILSYRKKTFGAGLLATVVLVIVAIGLFLDPVPAQPDEEEKEKIMAFVGRYADAHCQRDGAAVVSFYTEEETAMIEEEERLLEKEDGGYTYGFSSPWPDSYRYEMIWEENRADICYYAWSSEPHIIVWREEIQYIKSGEGYRVKESSLRIFDNISSVEEFEEAYRINGEYQFVDYVTNGFVEAIAYQKENGDSSTDNTVYGKPETAAAHILNLTGGEGRVEANYTYQATVRYLFADGSEIMIPMYMPLAEQGEDIWIVDTAVWNAGAP